MEYRQLGCSGLRVSLVGLGTSAFGRQCDADATREILDRAFDLGINFVDTANGYAEGRAEEYIGLAVRGRRQQVVIATKVGARLGPGPLERGLSRAHVTRAVDDSLRRLGTDYIDLYQCHLPDESTPLEETIAALDDAVRQGKVRYVGCSNFAAWQMCAWLWTADRRYMTRLASTQPRYNLLDRSVESDILPFCRSHGVGIIPYHPLAAGVLTGKYRDGQVPAGSRFAGAPQLQAQLTPARLAAVARLEAWAAERGHTVGELAIAWLASHREVSTIIAGATRPDQVSANAAGAGWTLSAAEAREVESLVTPGP